MAIPDVGWLVNCEDTEGDMFSIMQSDESAKSNYFGLSIQLFPLFDTSDIDR